MKSIAVTALLVALATAALAQPAPTRGIVNVTGQLYRAQNNNHYTVFLVTPEGVIMSDPINREFGRWLKSEIASRFKVPVRYGCTRTATGITRRAVWSSPTRRNSSATATCSRRWRRRPAIRRSPTPP